MVIGMRLLFLLFPFSFLLLSLTSCSTSDFKKSSETKRSSTHIFKVSPSQGNLVLNRALSDAKNLLVQNENVEILLGAGTYYLDSPIVLGAEFSGTDQTAFSMRAQKNAQVILSAGKKLDLKWSKHSENVFKATVQSGTFDQLYINGERQVRARYPNYDPSVLVFNGFSADAIDPQRINFWTQPAGGYIHSLHEARWGGMHHQITGVDDNGELMLDGGFQNNRASDMHKKYRYVENVYDELDAPGEWFYSKKDSTLYYYPPNNLDLDGATIETSNLAHIIEIRGTADEPVKNINIEGIECVHTAQTFMQTREQLLRSDWAIYRGGAVLIEHAENIKISNSDFNSLGGNAVFVSNYNRGVEISGNHIYDIGASAISFVGNPDAVRSPSFEYNEFVPIEDMDSEPGPKSNNYPSLSFANDNLIHDIGWVEKQVAGVQISMASEITVAHNSIYRVPRAGINVSEGTWGGHLLEYNDVFDTVLETGDHGAFNSWGRDRFWHPDRAIMDQLAADHPGMWKLDAQKKTIIRNSRWQCDHGWDIDLDDGSSNYEIYNNLMLNGGLKLREGFKRIATNNIIINNSFHPHVWFENSEDVFKNNLITASHKPILNEHWGDEINSNYFLNQGGLDKAKALGLDSKSLVVAADFINSEVGDFRLKNNSPAIKSGFKNFSMHQFGVKSKRLKKLAEQPDIPELFFDIDGESKGKTLKLLGAEFKNIETLGEQSSLGASEMKGAMVISVDPKSIAAREGLMVRDLILKVQDLTFGGEDDIDEVNDFLNAYQSRKWRGVLDVVVLRNQKPHMFTIDLLE